MTRQTLHGSGALWSVSGLGRRLSVGRVVGGLGVVGGGGRGAGGAGRLQRVGGLSRGEGRLAVGHRRRPVARPHWGKQTVLFFECNFRTSSDLYLYNVVFICKPENAISEEIV